MAGLVLRTLTLTLFGSNDLIAYQLYSHAVVSGDVLRGLPGTAARLGVMPIVVNQQRFFVRLGKRVRELRARHRYSQEDMIAYGFSARHWQQIEAGRPITVSTLLRICAVFNTSAEQLVRGLDQGIYENR